MSEEGFYNMDKKNGNRPTSVPPKGNDGKKNVPDNGTPKFQKFPKRRDYNNTRSYQDGGSGRKPTPQKNRVSVDKRPRSRAPYQQREYMTVEDQIDYEAPINLRSKKVNLNHLLNFSYNYEDSHRERITGRGHYRGGRGGRHSGFVRYNKEQFLQANCQFMVKAEGDYAIHRHNPDSLVDWDSVQLIRVYSHELSSCPICLSQPTAAKMTRCGHIYCWACILHYLALGEKSWRKCPICYESIHEKDLKSVISKEVHNYKVGETITMRLMKRDKGSVSAFPASLGQKDEGQFLNMNECADRTRFQKLLLATKDNVLSQVLRPERLALELQMENAEPSEVAFIDSALHSLKAREDELMGNVEGNEGGTTKSKSVLANPELSPSTTSKPGDVRACDRPKVVRTYTSAFSDEEDAVVDEKPVKDERNETMVNDRAAASSSDTSAGRQVSTNADMPSQAQSEEAGVRTKLESLENTCPVPAEIVGDTMPAEEAAEHLEMPSTANVSSSSAAENAYYFYQAADGQHIYLHAINARCLVHENGALYKCPEVITAQIVQMEGVFMSEELRKRLRYLGHLPLTCEFQVAELALKPPVISKDTLKHFADDIEKRRRLRQKRNREERRWNKKVEDYERKTLGMTPDGTTIVKSQFGVQSENRPVSPAAKSDDSSTSSLVSPMGSPGGFDVSAPEFKPGSLEHGDGQQTSNISFAQMLKVGKTQTVAWPKAKKDEQISPSVSGRPADSDESDPEEKAPEYNSSFGDAFQVALDNLAKTPPKGTSADVGQVKSSGKKKKKQQKLLLFSTAMARGGK